MTTFLSSVDFESGGRMTMLRNIPVRLREENIEIGFSTLSGLDEAHRRAHRGVERGACLHPG